MKVEKFVEIDCRIGLDNTLYPASVNLFSQTNIKMSNYIMKLLMLTRQLRKMRAEYWKNMAPLAGLRKIMKLTQTIS